MCSTSSLFVPFCTPPRGHLVLCICSVESNGKKEDLFFMFVFFVCVFENNIFHFVLFIGGTKKRAIEYAKTFLVPSSARHLHLIDETSNDIFKM